MKSKSFKMVQQTNFFEKTSDVILQSVAIAPSENQFHLHLPPLTSCTGALVRPTNRALVLKRPSDRASLIAFIQRNQPMDTLQTPPHPHYGRDRCV